MREHPGAEGQDQSRRKRRSGRGSGHARDFIAALDVRSSCRAALHIQIPRFAWRTRPRVEWFVSKRLWSFIQSLE